MKGKGILSTLVAVCILTAIAVPALAQVHVAKGFIANDLDKAKQVAARQDKPIYIHFTTDWCGWCRKIESETYPSPLVKAAMKKFVAVSLDCTDESSPKVQGWKQLMAKVGGGGYPTLAMITADGDVLNMVGGYVQPEVLKRELDKALDKYSKIKEFRQYEKTADTASLGFNIKAMDAYYDLGQYEKARKSAKMVIKADPENKTGKLADAHLLVINSLNQGDSLNVAAMKQAEDFYGKLTKLSDGKETLPKLTEALLSVTEIGIKTITPKMASDQITAQVAWAVEKIDELEKLVAADSDNIIKLQVLTANLGLVRAQSGDKDAGIVILKRAVAQSPESPIAGRIKSYAKSIGLDLD